MDTVIVFLLTAFDRLMDFISGGGWSRIRGGQKAPYKSKVEVE